MHLLVVCRHYPPGAVDGTVLNKIRTGNCRSNSHLPDTRDRSGIDHLTFPNGARRHGTQILTVGRVVTTIYALDLPKIYLGL